MRYTFWEFLKDFFITGFGVVVVINLVYLIIVFSLLSAATIW